MLPKVTVICTTFNHVDYVKDALEGFVNQKTTFPFEVIVHDDASTDGTAEIVADYGNLYPEIIHPILQSTNKHVLGVNIWREYILPKIKSEYIASCEGDDYWISSMKLQKQYDFLESHREYSACLHNALILDYGSDCAYLSERNLADKDKQFAQLILEGGGRINPTASIFYRMSCRGTWKRAPVGDHFLLMSLASKGKIRWLSTPMSVYRFMAKGSWSVRDAAVRNVAERYNYHTQYIEALEAMNESTNHIEDSAFGRRIQQQFEKLEDEAAWISFVNRNITLKDLVCWSGLSKTTFKALSRRYLSENVQKKIKTVELKLRKRKEQTLIATKLTNLPAWCAPLRK